MLVFCVNLSLSFFLDGFNQQTIFSINPLKRSVKMFLIALTIKLIFYACAFLYFIQLQTMFLITAIRCTFQMALNTLNTQFVFIPPSVFLYNFICILNKVKVVATFTFYRLFFSICFILISNDYIVSFIGDDALYFFMMQYITFFIMCLVSSLSLMNSETESSGSLSVVKRSFV